MVVDREVFVYRIFGFFLELDAWADWSSPLCEGGYCS